MNMYLLYLFSITGLAFNLIKLSERCHLLEYKLMLIEERMNETFSDDS